VEQNQTKTLRVLVVDDNQVFLRFLERYLKSVDDLRTTTVGRAENGMQAVELARALRPDLILMDVAMPKLSGIAAAKIIRKEGCRSKIVIITAHDIAEYRRAAFAAGADAFVAKDELFDNLSSTLCKLFSTDSEGIGGHFQSEGEG